MVTVKEIRKILADNNVIDVRDLAKLADDEILEKYQSNCKDDGEVIIDGIIYIPRGGRFENYWHRADDGSNNAYQVWACDISKLPDHPANKARIIVHILELAPGCIIEWDCDGDVDCDICDSFDEAMDELHDIMEKFADIW
jgi:hypothetical protein